MKEYTLKFGLHYKINKWHVVCKKGNELVSDCDHTVLMGHADTSHQKKEGYIYPIDNEEKYDNYQVDYNLSYNRLCPKCKKKFQLTEEDINHYIVLAKLGIKI